MRTHVVSSVAATVVVMTTAGCGPAGAPRDNASVAAVTPEYSPQGRLARLTSDANGDGRVDTWAFMDGTRVVRVEVDENGDGAPDEWQYHAEPSPSAAGTTGTSGAAQPPDRTLQRVERATRHDGRITRREFFSDGALTRVEEDTDADGTIDKWETYRNGTLAMMELDTQKRGTPDRRLVYDADGNFVRIEADRTGSGAFTPLSTP